MVCYSLMGPGVIVFHFPKPELVFAFFGILESQDMEQVFVVRSIRPLDEPIFPRLSFWNERMDAAVFLDGFGEERFAVRLAGIFHGKVAGIVGEGDEKGGSRSRAF